jgi:hypothetical protein
MPALRTAFCNIGKIMSTANLNADDDEIIAATRRWLERAVIGLNLCPFAKAVYVKEQVRYVVSPARTPGSAAGNPDERAAGPGRPIRKRSTRPC